MEGVIPNASSVCIKFFITQPRLIVAVYEHAFSPHCSPYISIGAVRRTCFTIKNSFSSIFLTTFMFDYLR